MNSNKYKVLRQFLWLILLLILPFSVLAQTLPPKSPPKPPTPVGTQIVLFKSQDFNLDSKLMARKMPYRVILPVNYMTSNEKTFYPTIYLLHGLTGHFDNWADKTKLIDYAEARFALRNSLQSTR